MTNGWILDVLADLTLYAQKNELPALERQLQRTTSIAVLETASTQGMARESVQRGLRDAGIAHRAAAEGRNA